MSLIFATPAAIVKPADEVAMSANLNNVEVGEAEPDDAHWDFLADEAALEAAWGRACDLGHLPC